MFKLWYSLRVRLLVVTFIAMFPVLALLAYSITQQHHQAADVAYAQTLQVARDAAHDHEEFIEEGRQFLKILSLQTQVQQGDTTACNILFTKLLEENPRYANIALVNNQGDFIASALPYDGHPNVSERLFFKTAMQTGNFAIGDYQLGYIAKVPTIHLAYPLVDKQRRVKSMLGVAMDLHWVGEFMKMSELPTGSTISILDRHGIILARYPNNDKWVGKYLPDATTVRAIHRAVNANKREGTTEGPGLDGTKRLYTYAMLPHQTGGAVYIVVGIPAEHVFAGVKHTTSTGILDVVIITVVVILVIWLGCDWLVLRRLNMLIDTTGQLSGGNLSARTGIGYEGEIGHLAQAFDEMAASLEHQQKNLYELLDGLPGNVRVQGMDYSIRFANKNFRRDFGEPAGRTCYEIMEGRSTPCESCTSILSRDKSTPVSWERASINGHTYEVYERLHQDLDGTPLVIRIGIDVTDKKQLEQEIMRLDRLSLVGEMAGGIAHEIRNPMTSVRGFLQLLREKQECLNYREYFNLMIDELDRANTIITDYLSLAKKAPEDLQNCNLNTIIRELQPLIESDIHQQQMSLVMELSDIPEFPLNNREIKQLLLNLTRNGLDAMSPGGMLTISTRQIKNQVVLAVRDEGTGIPPQVLEKIGTPFITTKDTGTGLGLAVCYSIVTRHGAKLDVDTSHAGTTFYVRFGVNG